MQESTRRTNGQMPGWLAEAWEPRVVPILARTIVEQAPEDQAAIYAGLERGPVEFAVDAERRRVIFAVGGLAFCEIGFDLITGIRPDGQPH